MHTYVVDNKEADDIFLSFMKASVPELDASTDLALAEVTYRAASKNKVKYVMEGHSFVTEGISPIGTGEKRKARKAMGKAKSDGDGSFCKNIR